MSKTLKRRNVLHLRFKQRYPAATSSRSSYSNMGMVSLAQFIEHSTLRITPVA